EDPFSRRVEDTLGHQIGHGGTERERATETDVWPFPQQMFVLDLPVNLSSQSLVQNREARLDVAVVFSADFLRQCQRLQGVTPSAAHRQGSMQEPEMLVQCTIHP